MAHSAFIHIPKTAGTKTRHNLNTDKYSFAFSYGETEIIDLDEDGNPFPLNNSGLIRNMNRKAMAKFLRADVLYGHVTLRDYQKILPEDAQYYTVMRNPIDRVISYYNHAQSYHADFKSRKQSILKFISSTKEISDYNSQVLHLSGAPSNVEINTDHLSAAKLNVVSGRIIVGIQEFLEQSIELMPIFRPLKAAPTSKRNFIPPRQKSNSKSSLVNQSIFGFSRESLTEYEVGEIARLNKLDIQLYNYCLKFVQEKLAAKKRT